MIVQSYATIIVNHGVGPRHLDVVDLSYDELTKFFVYVFAGKLQATNRDSVIGWLERNPNESSD